VRFFGYWSAVEELYAAADVLLAPARDAGLGLSTMEAIACGLPVVATDIPAMRRLVEHERTGLLVPPENPDALANAALRLLNDRALAQQFARNALQTAEQFHIRHTVAANRAVVPQADARLTPPTTRAAQSRSRRN
jgi:glycosyltransferase involved in cell wall biosynthesis